MLLINQNRAFLFYAALLNAAVNEFQVDITVSVLPGIKSILIPDGTAQCT